MKIYVYLDESGSIHKNSSTKFFAIGGYFVLESEHKNILINYKRVNKKIKQKQNLPMNMELKANQMSIQNKIELIKSAQKVETFCACAKVFMKEKMYKEISKENIFYNYGVNLLIRDCIMPLIEDIIKTEKVEFVLNLDNRNIKVESLKGLEDYLKTDFLFYNQFFDIDFKVTYYDSKVNYGIQLADLIVNSFYMKYKNEEIVVDVLDIIQQGNYRLVTFPEKIIEGRTEQLNIPTLLTT